MRGHPKVDEVWCFVVVDSDGTEGIPASPAHHPTDGWFMLPSITTKAESIEQMRRILLTNDSCAGRTAKLVKFSNREVLETFQIPKKEMN